MVGLEAGLLTCPFHIALTTTSSHANFHTRLSCAEARAARAMFGLTLALALKLPAPCRCRLPSPVLALSRILLLPRLAACRPQRPTHRVPELRLPPDPAVAVWSPGAAHAVQRLRRALQERPAPQLLAHSRRHDAATGEGARLLCCLLRPCTAPQLLPFCALAVA